MFDTVIYALAAFAAASLSTYILPMIIQSLTHRPQNLKIKYKAEWALVSGGSSGIGLAITQKLASQGINVVIVALDDALLHDSKLYLSSSFPNVEFRCVGVDLGSSDSRTFMDTIIHETRDLNVNIIFNNAGYIQVGLFALTPLEKVLANINCNSVSSVHITHHFVNLMLSRKQTGLVSFTSSPGGFMPSPMAPMYSATKSFITNFASSIAGELKPDGIDVCVVHPSPINTGFYKNAGLMSALKFFQKTAASPSVISDALFSAAGRTVVVDQGYYTILNRILLKVIDVCAMSELMTAFVSGQADFTVIKTNQQKIAKSK